MPVQGKRRRCLEERRPSCSRRAGPAPRARGRAGGGPRHWQGRDGPEGVTARGAPHRARRTPCATARAESGGRSDAREGSSKALARGWGRRDRGAAPQILPAPRYKTRGPGALRRPAGAAAGAPRQGAKSPRQKNLRVVTEAPRGWMAPGKGRVRRPAGCGALPRVRTGVRSPRGTLWGHFVSCVAAELETGRGCCATTPPWPPPGLRLPDLPTRRSVPSRLRGVEP